MDQTSKIMPKWMQIKKGERPLNNLKSQEYNSFVDVSYKLNN